MVNEPKKKILILNGHPRKESFNDALASAYNDAATSAGAKVRQINVRDLKFNPNVLTSPKDELVLETDLKKAQKDILWADHIVITYPLWWGFMPALLKGFFDRTFTPGFAYKFRKSGLPLRLLSDKTARVITTMDMPKIIYRFVYRSSGSRILNSAILSFCGIRAKTTLLTPISRSTPKKREAYLAKVTKLGTVCK